MKIHRIRALALLLAVVMLFALASPALGAWEDFPDIRGHWAEDTMHRAYSDGLVEGFEDQTLRPDSPITAAQMITILCRVLDADYSGSYEALGLTGEEWYADAAVSAAALGLISSASGLDGAMRRADALTMMAKAFQLVYAEPDYSVLAGFSDSSALSGEVRQAMASLVSDAYVIGYDGSLNAAGSITRAEFFTVLYRVANNYVNSSDVNSARSGGAVISAADSLSGAFTGNVWLNCSSSGTNLQGVTAPTLVLRGDSLNYVNFYNINAIDRLVLAAVSGATSSVSVSPSGANSVGTLVVGDTNLAVTTGGKIGRIEITGSGRAVTVTAPVDELVISGSGCTVTVNSGVTVGAVRLTGGASSNSLTVKGAVNTLDDAGYYNSIDGSGVVGVATINSGHGGSFSVSANSTVDMRDSGIEGTEITLTAPAVLPAGETLSVTAKLSAPESASGKEATISWYIDGVFVKSQSITVSSSAVGVFTYDMEYTRDLPASCVVSCALSYTTEQGDEQNIGASVTVQLENYDEEYYRAYDTEAVLAAVTTGYKGNYTLQWALDNDYDQQTKTIWVNAKGYASTTRYLIWVSLAYQRVNIFEGSKGNWTLIHEYLCGSGAPGTPTPVGVYTVFGKQVGWFTSTYTCRPVVNFKTGSGYAFHSRLYNPGWSETFTDARIGFPVSHGCLRMYSEDVQWMYDNIPIGTTVVVF